MNIYLKTVLVFCITIFLSGCAWSLESKIPAHDFRIHQCDAAKYGELDIALLDSNDPFHNSFLLNCAVSVVVPGPDEGKNAIMGRIEKKQAIAAFLLTNKLDINYKDQDGVTLLMAVILSYMSEDWKEKAVKRLIDKGCSIQTQNNYGKTAADLAKFKGNKKIIRMLTEDSY